MIAVMPNDGVGIRKPRQSRLRASRKRVGERSRLRFDVLWPSEIHREHQRALLCA